MLHCREPVTNGSGIIQNARLGKLAHHLRKRLLVYVKPIRLQQREHQRRTLLLAHGGQLGSVAHKHQAAPLPRVDILDKVVEQTPRAEGR